MQAQQGDNIAAVKIEKQQVATLANYLEQLLEMLPPSENEPIELLEEPDDPNTLLWTAGGMEIGYSANQDKIALFIEELDADEAAEDTLSESLDRIRVFLRRDQTLAFIRRAREIIAAGRPLCRFCGEPLNTDDGFCPCAN